MHVPMTRFLRSAIVLILVAVGEMAHGQSTASDLTWPPVLDAQNKTTKSFDGRTIERYVHGARAEWGYPANANWNYPAPEGDQHLQNSNSFYVVAPKVPHDGAPLCVVLHSANRTAFDYMGYSSLDATSVPKAITGSPDDFYALYLNSTNDEWWGWNQAKASAAFAQRRNEAPPAERRVMDTIEWVAAKYHVDRNRIYLCGMSMGGCGTLGIGLAHGDVFAATLACAPAGTEYGAYRTDNFISRAGQLDPPPLVDFSAGNDGWSATQSALVQATVAQHWPFVLGWGAFGHTGDKSEIGKFPACQVSLAFPWQEIKKNEAYAVFTRSSIDDHSQWLASANQDPAGQMNAWLRWKDETDTPERFAIQLFIANPHVPDPTVIVPDDATADVTPRRFQQFKVEAGKSYEWELTRGGHVVASGKVAPDAANLLTIPQVPLKQSPSTLSLRPAP